MMELAQSRGGAIVDLSVGDPDFVTPPHIIGAAAAAATEGYTKYPPAQGFLRLRELVAEKLARRNGLSVTSSTATTSARRPSATASACSRCSRFQRRTR